MKEYLNEMSWYLTRELLENDQEFWIMVNYSGFTDEMTEKTKKNYPRFIELNIKDNTLEHAEVEDDFLIFYLMIDGVETEYHLTDGSQIQAVVVNGITVYENPFEVKKEIKKTDIPKVSIMDFVPRREDYERSMSKLHFKGRK
jgi:hypothetical protein